MKIWEEFKSKLLTIAVNGNLFYTNSTLPKTNKEKYWYNRGLQDSLKDLKSYEKHCEYMYSKKHDSLIKCLSQHKFFVCYDEVTNTTHISEAKELHLIK